jgi:hypothetical protein
VVQLEPKPEARRAGLDLAVPAVALVALERVALERCCALDPAQPVSSAASDVASNSQPKRILAIDTQFTTTEPGAGRFLLSGADQDGRPERFAHR